MFCCDLFNFFFDDFALNQALADPRKSTELREFVQDVFHSETTALLHEHNGVIQMQREQIAQQGDEIRRLRQEHATEISALNAAHAADMAARRLEIQALDQKRMEAIDKHATDIVALHTGHASEIQALHRDCTEKLKAKSAEAR